MDCKECIHLKRGGHVSHCELFDNVTQYGEIGNEPLVENCGHFTAIKKTRRECETFCDWRPLRKFVKNGVVHFMLQSDCGRLIDYGQKTDSIKEIEKEHCKRCKRLIRVHWINGMEK